MTAAFNLNREARAIAALLPAYNSQAEAAGHALLRDFPELLAVRRLALALLPDDTGRAVAEVIDDEMAAHAESAVFKHGDSRDAKWTDALRCAERGMTFARAVKVATEAGRAL